MLLRYSKTEWKSIICLSQYNILLWICLQAEMKTNMRIYLGFSYFQLLLEVT